MKTTHAVTAKTTINGAEWKALVHFEHLGSTALGSEIGRSTERPVFAALLTRNGEALPDWFTGEGKVSCTVPWLGGLDGRMIPFCPPKKSMAGKIPAWMVGVRGWQTELRKACSALSKEIRTQTVGEVRDLTVYPMDKGEFLSRLAYLDAVPPELRDADYQGHAVETFERLFGAAEYAITWHGWRGSFPWRIGVREGKAYVAVAPVGNNPYGLPLGYEMTAPVSLGLFPAIHGALEKIPMSAGSLADGQRLDQAPAPILARLRAFAFAKVGPAMSVASRAELSAWYERLLAHEKADFLAALSAPMI